MMSGNSGNVLGASMMMQASPSEMMEARNEQRYYQEMQVRREALQAALQVCPNADYSAIISAAKAFETYLLGKKLG